MITFWLSTLTAGDPIEKILGTTLSSEEATLEEVEYALVQYKTIAHQYHFDLPKFYFSILPSNYPDTLNRVFPIAVKEQSIKLLKTYGNWVFINRYQQELNFLQKSFLQRKFKSGSYSSVIYKLNQLTQATEKKEIKTLLDDLNDVKKEFLELESLPQLIGFFEQMKKSNRVGLLVPKITWNGLNNQYHLWFSAVLKGDFGKSIRDKKPVIQKIAISLPTTLLLNIVALLLAIIIGIGTGVFMSVNPEKKISKILLSKMYAWLAIPSFWLASLLVIFFTSTDYGSWTNLFPSGGIGNFPIGVSFFQKVAIRSSHLFLPVISLAIPFAAVLAIQMRKSLADELNKTYIKTAILKGVSAPKVLWRHGVRNALFPILTLFGNVLPALIGGSVAIESIFNIPGMGLLLLSSIYSNDWPVVFAILLITAVLTILSLLVTDIIYTKLDPRIDLKGDKTMLS